MTETLGRGELAKVILDFASQENSVCFAGAGVGVRAGLPDWTTYIQGLAQLAGEYENELADLMRKRIDEGQLAEAAHFYKRASIPAGVLHQKLAEPFLEYDSTKLRALASLPFTAYVTTNYDRAFHDAWAAAWKRAPRAVERGDKTLRTAIHDRNFYIARVHGRVELPQTMVLDTDDFRDVLADSDYSDFLFHILGSQRCLFIGYSFMDPAITTVLKLFEDRVGPNFPEEHLAIIPEGSGELRAKLLKFNVRTVYYSVD